MFVYHSLCFCLSLHDVCTHPPSRKVSPWGVNEPACCPGNLQTECCGPLFLSSWQRPLLKALWSFVCVPMVTCFKHNCVRVPLSHTLVHTLDLSLCPHHHQNCSRSFRPCLMRTHFRHRTASSAPTTVFWERSASSNTIHAHVNVLPSTNSETISTSARNMQAPRLAHTSTYSQEWARSG